MKEKKSFLIILNWFTGIGGGAGALGIGGGAGGAEGATKKQKKEFKNFQIFLVNSIAIPVVVGASSLAFELSLLSFFSASAAKVSNPPSYKHKKLKIKI